MGDREPLQVYLSQTQKTRWKGYIEDSPKFQSMADLVRTSVEEHIAAGGKDEGNLKDSFDDLAGGVDELHKDITKLEEQLRLTRLDLVDEEQFIELVISGVETELERFEFRSEEPRLDYGHER